MKKIILTAAFAATSLFSFAQVGVGTENPTTTLEVVGANATDTGATGVNTPGALAAGDGITVPVVTTDMRASESPVAGVKVGQLVYSTDVDSTGFYYWSGTAWLPVGGGAAPAAPTFRTTNSNDITDADLNNYIIYNGTTNVTYDLATLNPVAGDKITILDAASVGTLSVTQAPLGSGVRRSQLAAGGSLTYIFDGTVWYLLQT